MDGKLKEIREYEGLTQAEVAKKLHVARSTYAGWECGKDMIPLPKLNDFANTFHVSLDYLVGKFPKPERINKIFKIDKELVSENLVKFRKENNLTQADLAKDLNTSQPNISKYESGSFLITTYYALEFSKKYDYSLDKLVGRK